MTTFTLSNLTVKVGATTVVSADNSLTVRPTGFRIDDPVNGNSTFTCQIWDANHVLSVQNNTPVTVTDNTNNNVLFSGYIDRYNITAKPQPSGARLITITCKDQHYLANKRSCGGKNYSNTTSDAIVQDLINSGLSGNPSGGILSQEGVSGVNLHRTEALSVDWNKTGSVITNGLILTTPTFTRASVATKSDGTQVSSGTARFDNMGLVTEGTTNMLTNAEADPTGSYWYNDAGSTITYEATHIAVGTSSLKCVCDGTTDWQGVTTNGLPTACSPNALYTVSGYIAANTTDTLQLGAYCYNSGTYLTNYTLSITPTATATRYTYTFTTPATCNQIAFLIFKLSKTVSTFWLNGVQLEQKDHATPWTQGTRAPVYATTGLTIEEGTTNYFSPNQSNGGEDGTTTGFSIESNATVANSTAQAWQGAHSIKVDTSAVTAYSCVDIDYANSPSGNTQITMSAYLRGNVGGETLDMAVFDDGGWVAGKVITLTASWQRFSITCTTHNQAITLVRLKFGTDATPIHYTFYVDGCQLEATPYATSWVPGQVTRAAEAVTLPNSVLTAAQGTFEAVVNVTADQLAMSSDSMLFYFSTSGSGNLSFGIPPWTHMPYAWIRSDAGVYAEGGSSNTPLTVGLHRLAITWQGSTTNLYLDGVMVYTINGTLPSSAIGNVSLGSAYSASAYFCDTQINDVVISNIARPYAVMAARGVTTPLGMDANTTFYAPLTSTSGITSNAIGSNSGLVLANNSLTLAASASNYSKGYVTTTDFNAGSLTNINDASNQLALTTAGSNFSTSWTTTANFGAGGMSPAGSINESSNQLALAKTGSDFSQTENSAGTLGTGTLTDVNAAGGYLCQTAVYSDTCDSTTGWTVSNMNVQANGNPGNAFNNTSTSSRYMYRDVGVGPNMVVELDIYMPANAIGEIMLMQNSSGAGQMYRLDSRSGYTNGWVATTSWTGWSTNGNGTGPCTGNVWHHLKIDIGATTATGYIDGTANGGAYTFANNGTYICLIGEAVTGVRFDNIVIYKKSGTRNEPAISLTSVGTNQSSTISWTVGSQPAGTSVAVQTSWTNNGSDWATCTSGSAIPGLSASTNMNGMTLYIREVFNTTATATATISSIVISVPSAITTTGAWTSQSNSITSVGNASASSISWTQTLNGGTVAVSASVDGSTYYPQTSGQPIVINGTNINNNYSCSGKSLYVKVSMTQTAGSSVSPTVTNISTSVTSAYSTTGTWFSPASTISSIYAITSNITWSQTLNGGTVTVKASVDGSNYYPQTSGQPIVINGTNIANNYNCTGVSLYINVAMTPASGYGATPVVSNIQTSIIAGYCTCACRYSPPMDISLAGYVSGVQILWDRTLPDGNCNVSVEYSLDNVNWEPMVNGSGIPEINDQYVIGQKIYLRQTLTSTGMSTPVLQDITVNAWNGSVQGGISITNAQYDINRMCSDVIADMATQTGYWWAIDSHKVLWFCDYNYLPSYVTVDSADGDVLNTSKLDVQNVDYGNQWFIRGGVDTSSPQTQYLYCDGTTKSWSLQLPVQSMTGTVNSTTLGVWVNGSQVPANQVGIGGIDTGKLYYWNTGSNVFSANTAPTNGTSLYVVYTAQYPSIAMSNDPAEIYRLKALDGSSGIVDRITDQPKLTKSADEIAYANNLISSYSMMGRTMSIDTHMYMVPGQLYTFNVPELDVNYVDMMVTSCTTSVVGANPSNPNQSILKFAVTATENTVPYRWSKFYRDLANKSLAVNGQNSNSSILTTTAPTADAPVVHESVGAGLKSQLPNPALYPNKTVFPC